MFLRETIRFAAERLMEMEMGALTGAVFGERSGERLAQPNGCRGWQTQAGTIELRLPKLRKGSYFPEFVEISWAASKYQHRHDMKFSSMIVFLHARICS